MLVPSLKNKKGTYGSQRRAGKAVSWIFEGALKPMSNRPRIKFGFLKLTITIIV